MERQPNLTIREYAASVIRACSIIASALFAASVAAAPRQPVIPIPEIAPLLWHESFDELYSFQETNDLVTASNGWEYCSSWSGYAIFCLSDGSQVTPYVVPGVDSRGQTKVGASTGALRLWLTPCWPATGPGANARLLTLYGTAGDQPAELWTLQVSPDASSLSLVAQSDSGPVQVLQLPIAWTGQAPHCVLLNYGPQGVALFLDNQLAAQSSTLLPVPTGSWQLVLGSSLAGTETAQAAIDEAFSFRRPLTASELSFYYNAIVGFANLGPLSDAALAARLQAKAAQVAAARQAATDMALNRPMVMRANSRVSSMQTFSIQGLPLVTNVPTCGTFWSLQRPECQPTPCDPFGDTVPVYQEPDGSYLINDLAVDYAAMDQARTFPPLDSSTIPTNGLYLEITSIGSSSMGLLVWGTSPGVAYTLENATALAPSNTAWAAQQSFTGATNTNATPLQVSLSGSSAIFLRALTGTVTNQGYPPGTLWIEPVSAANGVVSINVHGTSADTLFDILSATNLAEPVAWNSEVPQFPGAAGQDWTPVPINMSNQPALFLLARSWVSGDGSGIPTWWEDKYMPSGANPYTLCPCGDGWTYLQCYQNGWNPSNWCTPPAPQGVTVSYNYITGAVNVNWQPSPGPVTGYTVQRSVYPDDWNPTSFAVSANARSFQDTIPEVPSDLRDCGPSVSQNYWVIAHYTNGDSPRSAGVPLEPSPTFSYALVASNGTAYLQVSGLSPNTAALRFSESDWSTASIVTNWIVPVSASIEGLYQIPSSATPQDIYGYDDYYWWVQAVAVGNGLSAASLLSDSWEQGDIAFGNANAAWMSTPFFNGQQQIKQNVDFLLRVPRTGPFYVLGTGRPPWLGCSYPDVYWPASYVFSGLYAVRDDCNQSDEAILNPFEPFAENYLFRNFVISSNDIDPADLSVNTGVTGTLMYGSYGEANLVWPPKYQCPMPTNADPIPAPVGFTHWTAGDWPFSAGPYGVTSDSTNFYLDNAAYNYFGLQYEKVLLAYNPWLVAPIPGDPNDPGDYPPIPGVPDTNDVDFAELDWNTSIPIVSGPAFPQTVAPQLQTVGYYFARPSTVAPPYTDPLPGNSTFSPTNTTPSPMIIPFGQSFQLAGYAKQQLLNGYPNIYAYVGQYFSNAYTIDATGSATTTTTGFLSPYGTFFPTMPGPAALVTMPDIDSGAQGTNVVYVIKLALDVNHDGTMDLSFGGPDNTSAASPYVLWCNNNFDRWDNDYPFNYPEQDDQLSAGCPYTPLTPTPDCNYSNACGQRVIPCTRDLEDYARLWVCGLTTNCLTNLPIGSSVWLSWGDVGYPNPSNPTIDLFLAADPDGGIGYLTNETTATLQTNIAQCPYAGRVAPGCSIQLNSLMNQLPSTHFIWCGVSNGVGGLTLTISDANGNVLAQTTAYIQIQDIKQMYERWTVGDEPSVPPTNTPYLVKANLAPGELPFQYALPATTNTPYIVLVHGYNMQPWEKDRFAETAFKRLYWQGYQGRFGTCYWPTAQKALEFGSSEIQGWDSAQGLLNRLTALNSNYPGQVYLLAHSLGNVVAGEALRLAGANQVVNTYVSMQGAVSAHAYDPTTPRYNLWLDSGTPDCYAFYWTAGAPCYFNPSAGAGRYVNFFNTNDWALRVAWLKFQNLKPDIDHSYEFYPPSSYYKDYGSTALYFPSNTYEIFDKIIQSRSYALGMQPNVGGKFTVVRQVELDVPPYSFSTQHVYHSGEFRSDNAQRWQFWSQVLAQTGLK
jgi:hypothetical protein